MRPDCIAKLHEAKYELRLGSGAEKPALLAKYRERLAIAASAYGTTGPALEAAVAPDFGVWVKQEKLPKLTPPNPGQGQFKGI
jgi:hypothetical protein